MAKFGKGRGKAFERHVKFRSGVCFIASTLVLMSDGSYKPIEDVTTGDCVVCLKQDEVSTISICPVTATTSREVDQYWILCTSNGCELGATEDHPFLVRDHYWKKVSELDATDHIQTFSGAEVSLVSKDRITSNAFVYNLEVEYAHSYFVTHDLLVAHNGCMPPFITGAARPTGASATTTYILNVKTGEFILGKGEPHFAIWKTYGKGEPLGNFVGGFVNFKNGKFADADITSATFSGTQEMIDEAMAMFKLLRGR